MSATQGQGAGDAGAVPPVDEDAVWRAYRSFARETFIALERGLVADAGASVADLELMEPLLAADHRGLRAKDLAAAAGWQDSRVSHQLRRMEQRGLVVRSRDRQDARGTVVHLTPEGLGTARTATATRSRLVHELLVGALRPEQSAQFVQIVDQVLVRLAEHAADQAEGTGAPVVTASEVNGR
jgi:DNA-binding MarR family transcriptional regulator